MWCGAVFGRLVSEKFHHSTLQWISIAGDVWFFHFVAHLISSVMAEFLLVAKALE